MIQKLFNQGEAGSLRRKLTRNALGSFGLKIASVGLAFITTILLARLLGPEGYGLYAYATTWILVLQIPAGLGMKGILVRGISAYQTRSQWSLMHGLLRWANQSVLMVSVAITLLAAAVIWLAGLGSSSQELSVFWIALISLPLLALTAIRQSTMQGLHRVVVGQLPEMIIQPVLLIIFLVGGYLFLRENLNVTWAMSFKVLTSAIAFLVGTQLLRKNLPNAITNVSPNYETRIWQRSVLPFILIGCMNVINNRTDALMLGAMKGTEAVGFYVVANRGAGLVLFTLMAINQSVEPAIAKLYAEGNFRKLQSVITKSSRVIFFTSLPVALGLIIFGHWFLLIFGSEFTQGYTVLVILCLGQLVNAGMGSVGKLLNMTGHERDTAIGVGTSAVLNLILNAMLIPKWGIEGAATATTISTITWNILLVIFVKKRLGINTIAITKAVKHTNKS